MITMYTYSSGVGQRNAVKWFKENNIVYQERKITDNHPLSREEIGMMIYLVEDIKKLITCNSNIGKKLKYKLLDMHVKSELIPFIEKNPGVLKYPIIVRKFDITVGFGIDRYRMYIPREKRKKTLRDALRLIDSGRKNNNKEKVS